MHNTLQLPVFFFLFFCQHYSECRGIQRISLEETMFGSNRIKKQHETMKLQNEEVMLS